MKIVKPKVIVYKLHDFRLIKGLIERCARTCYRSEGSIKPGSADKLIRKLRDLGHGAMLEFGTICVRFVCSRSISHELVRHRLASFAQQSTRYCDEGSEKKFGGVNFIEPFFFKRENPVDDEIFFREKFNEFLEELDFPMLPSHDMDYDLESLNDVPKNSRKKVYMDKWGMWALSCLQAEWMYQTLRDKFGCSPQEAREVLPNCLRTEVNMQVNVREMRHILQLRCSNKAHPQIRQIMIPLLLFMQKELPVLFEDIEYDDEYKGEKIPLPEVEVVDVGLNQNSGSENLDVSIGDYD